MKRKWNLKQEQFALAMIYHYCLSLFVQEQLRNSVGFSAYNIKYGVVEIPYDL